MPIDDLTMAETVRLIENLVVTGRTNGTNHQIATVNVDFLVNAMSDEHTRSILQRADVCLPDGMPVVWGAGRLGMHLRERIAGADLVPLLIDASRTTGWRVHVFGSTPEVAAAARIELDHRYPGARFSIEPGPIIHDVADVDDTVLDQIADVDADILCVALGNPKQERFIDAHRERLRTPVMIGVGGAIDMLVGARRRAPAWAQRIGMEWLVRAAQEPHRLGRRYANDFRVFLPAYAAEWRSSRARQQGVGLELTMTDRDVLVRVGGKVVPAMEEWSSVARAVLDGQPVRVEADSVEGMQDAALAQLVGVLRLARRTGALVTWAGFQSVVERDAGRGAQAVSTLLYSLTGWRGHHEL